MSSRAEREDRSRRYRRKRQAPYAAPGRHAIALHNDAIRSIPRLEFYNGPVVPRRAASTCFWLLTDREKIFFDMTELDRRIVTASRAKTILGTAIDVARKPNRMHWSIVGVWKEVMEILHRHDSSCWLDGFSAERVTDVFDALVQARLAYRQSSSAQEIDSIKDFKTFLKTLDDWIAIKDTIAYLDKPPRPTANQIDNSAIKNEVDSDFEAFQEIPVLEPVQWIHRTGAGRRGMVRTESQSESPQVSPVQSPIPRHIDNNSAPADAAGSITTTTATLQSMYDEIEALKKENTRKSMTVEMAELEMLRDEVERLQVKSAADTARIREVEAEREAQDAISGQMSTVCQKLLDNNHELRAENNALRANQDQLWMDYRHYANPIQRARGYLEWEADDLDRYLRRDYRTAGNEPEVLSP
ncbi:hypothetical protein CkaCkLH20_09075 [Colletotrichum karsti]|uniref:Uncharacterized protein n=1 Tax=Colletotrichum karsti TaxID=1095194 RepID=A0A9P6HZZ3_9PEZI|nr:uncharacterized protein CkaCkLH20_09075 [Colletotrichum karsti]KAF9873262.1 hypothetical protein CkaCkLH20_09075 [Colletotrichum karsti]